MKKRLQLQILISLEVNGSCMPKIFPNGTCVHGMVSDHNLRTTDPNFMFLSIFHNVLRCLIHQNYENIGVLLNICRLIFSTVMRQAKIMDPERFQNFAIKHRTKTWNAVAFFVFD